MRRCALLISLVLLLALVQIPTASAQETVDSTNAATESDIRELLELTHTDSLMAQVLDQLLSQFRDYNPSVPEEWWEKARSKMKVAELIELLFPIYSKYLTHDDTRQLIDFYSSPIGRKLIEVQPMITQESMAAGRQWGEDAAKKLLEELQADGY